MKVSSEFLNKSASIFSVITAILLIAIKLFAYLLTGSVMILSSLADSFLDLTTSLVNFGAIIYSNQPRDRYHKFGHGAAEDIASFIQALLLGFSAIFIVYKSADSLIRGREIFCDTTCLTVMLASLGLTIILISYQKFVIKRTKSLVIEVDSLHYTTDILMNIVFLISLVAINHNPKLYFIDPIIALLVATYILKSSFKIGEKAFNNLMCREVNDKIRKQIIKIIKNHEGVKGYHDLRTRRMGSKIIIQCHVEIDKNLRLKEAHSISKKLEKEICEQFKNCDIIIHEDAV